MRRSRIRGEIIGIALWWSTRRGGEINLAGGHFEIVSIGKRAGKYPSWSAAFSHSKRHLNRKDSVHGQSRTAEC